MLARFVSYSAPDWTPSTLSRHPFPPTPRSNTVEHLKVKATAAPVTDLGEFEALVATWDRDREGDVIARGAFTKSIAQWREVGRLVPLHWNHKAEEIIGSIDPTWMAETEEGLEVAGRIDLDTEQGRDVWRSVKANRIGFSFGYLATKTR